jgi:hypothetical protein
MWRGSTVAIKTMILPAKMSGAEKRERMAIMEAAISSVMNHPNIVQVRDSARCQSRGLCEAVESNPAQGGVGRGNMGVAMSRCMNHPTHRAGEGQ